MAHDSKTETAPATTIVVAFKDAARSSAALRWSIERNRISGASLRVVQASAFPLTAHDGPSASVAQQLGNPGWATLHSAVAGFDPPADVHTVADQGSPHAVLEKWTDDATVVVLGRSRTKGWRRSLADRLRRSLDVPVLEIDESDLGVIDLGPERDRTVPMNDEGRISS